MSFALRRSCDVVTGAADARAPRDRGRWVLAVAILGSSMSFIDGSAVNVALPVIQRELHASASDMQWVVEAYALFLAALILTAGTLADRFGRRLAFGIGIAVFALASVACSAAIDARGLIIARSIQGIGGALVTPGSLALIGAQFSGDARARAIGVWSGFATITSAIGPLVGGFFAQHGLWRAVFLVNVPFAIVTLAMLVWRVPESRDPASSGNIDVAGSLLATAALACLVDGLIALQSGPADALAWTIVGAGVGFGAAFLVVEARVSAPMVPLALFRSRTFSTTNAYTLLLYFAIGGGLYFVPFELVDVQRYSPTAAGAAMLPFIAVLFAGSQFSGALVSRFGQRLLLVAGAAVTAAGYVAFALAGTGHSYWTTFFPAATVLGLGAAIFVAPLTNAVIGAVPTERVGIASGINNAVSRTAGLAAVALFGLVAASVFDAELTRELRSATIPASDRAELQRERARLVSGLLPANIVSAAGRAGAEAAVRNSSARGFAAVMLASAGCAAAGALLGLLVPNPPRSRRG